MKHHKMNLLLLISALICSIGISAHATDFPLTVTINAQNLGTKGVNESANATQSVSVTGTPGEQGTTSYSWSVLSTEVSQSATGPWTTATSSASVTPRINRPRRYRQILLMRVIIAFKYMSAFPGQRSRGTTPRMGKIRSTLPRQLLVEILKQQVTKPYTIFAVLLLELAIRKLLVFLSNQQEQHGHGILPQH